METESRIKDTSNTAARTIDAISTSFSVLFSSTEVRLTISIKPNRLAKILMNPIEVASPTGYASLAPISKETENTDKVKHPLRTMAAIRKS